MLVKRTLLAVSVLLNIFLVGYLFFGSKGIPNYQVLRSDLHTLSVEQNALDEKAYVLSSEIRLLQRDPDYIEKKVRERLGFVKENEVLYIYTDDKKTNKLGVRE